MKNYRTRIRTIAPYLQARFSPDAQKALSKKSGVKAFEDLIIKD